MKAIRIFLLVLIIIGIGLIITQGLWVPNLVTAILGKQNVSQTISTQSPISKTTPTTPQRTHSDSSFSVSPASGSAPLTVTFTYSFDINAEAAASSQFLVNFGDGTSGMMNVTNAAQVSHTYTAAGTYTATISFKNDYADTPVPNYVPLTDPSGNPLAQTITVTGAPVSVTCGTSEGCVVNKPSATIDKSSLISASTPTITGTVSGTSEISILVWQGSVTPPNSLLQATGPYAWSMGTEIRDSEISLSNGRWVTSIGNSEVAGLGPPVPYFANGTYTVAVYDETTDQLLTSGTLQITGPSIDVTNAGLSTVTFQYVDLPANSQVLLAGDSSNPPVVATVSNTGSTSFSIPGGLQGDYWLQVELNGNSKDMLQSGPFSANKVDH